MKNISILFTAFILLTAQITVDARPLNLSASEVPVKKVPPRQKIRVFIMAGQSNMAGRGIVEPQDTIIDRRIFSVNASGQLIYAREPLHFNDPKMAGLDCGLSFARYLADNLPGDVNILMIPAAVGGSSVSQWLGDSLHRNVKLLSNFREMIKTGKKYGTIKGILWHQGESDANETDIPLYKERLAELISIFRKYAGKKHLPVLIGELGYFSENNRNWQRINTIINEYSSGDKNTLTVKTGDLGHKGDKVHFNSAGQREMGRRFASGYLKKFSR
jgi:hypothetical protein